MSRSDDIERELRDLDRQHQNAEQRGDYARQLVIGAATNALHEEQDQIRQDDEVASWSPAEQ